MALKTTTDQQVKHKNKCGTEHPACSKSKRKIFKQSTFKKTHIHQLLQVKSHIIKITAVFMANTMFYPQYQHFSCPIGFSEWNPIVPVNTLYTVQPIPVIVNSAAILSTQTCPFVPHIPSVVAPPLIVSCDASPVSCYFESVSTELESPVGSLYNGANIGTESEDPIEHYLSLPKDLFPTARMMTIDPNKLIDEFCRLSNVYGHVSWILDLEFGIPNAPITRHIPIYNVKFNSIHCKNTPEAIHPGFESCDEEFKRALLFHYDCIVSAWYRGFVFLKGDESVENFQSWLLLPMQMLGMCWP